MQEARHRGAIRTTERPHPAAAGLDALPPASILDHLLTQQTASLAAVRPAFPAIESASRLLAHTLSSGGRIAYAGAGSSALMAMADGLELPGTYGIPSDRILLMMAGGLPTDSRMPGATEDDAGEGTRAAQALRAGDAAICVTASGSTPYPLAVAAQARALGASVIGIANTPGAPLFAICDIAICLGTPPEVVAGSTRMGAGSAQKACLNLISTLMAVILGEVHDGRMVGLVADNAKLRARAAGMVADIARCGEAEAAAALAAAGGAVKPAVLIARGLPAGTARSLLTKTGGSLRAALASLPPGR
ncbi:MAG: N-acetylmuramic acid 6-phosphate etherase [Paracoccaceae bacterium]